MGSRTSKPASAAKAVSQSLAGKAVEGAARGSGELPRRRGAPFASQPEEAYSEDVFRELSRLRVQRREPSEGDVSPAFPQNTAVIRYQEERRLDDYRRRHQTDRVPGRVDEDLLRDSLRRHREAPQEFTAERLSEEWQGADPETVGSVLRFVVFPQVVLEGETKVAT